MREASMLKKLVHPHIVRCEDTVWDDELRVVWLALELMSGGSLRNLIDCRRSVGSPFDAPFIRTVLAEIGAALDYIHSQGVMHRDVKPANVLLTLTAPPVLKLADFGIARLMETSGLAKTIVGTQHYFSPELAAGEPYGFASDCWALGVTLFELAALQKPFTATNAFALACRICNEPPADLPASTGQDIAEVVSGFLQKDPEQRLGLKSALDISPDVAMLVPGSGFSAEAGSAERIPRAVCESPFEVSLDGLPDLSPAPASDDCAIQPHVPSVAFAAAAVTASRNDSAGGERKRGPGRWWTSFANALLPSALSKPAVAYAPKEVTLVSLFVSPQVCNYDVVESNVECIGMLNKACREELIVVEYLPGGLEEIGADCPELLS